MSPGLIPLWRGWRRSLVNIPEILKSVRSQYFSNLHQELKARSGKVRPFVFEPLKLLLSRALIELFLFDDRFQFELLSLHIAFLLNQPASVFNIGLIELLNFRRT